MNLLVKNQNIYKKGEINMINKVILIGRLTSDPEVRYTPAGECVANVAIACNENWKDKNGVKQEYVEFISLVFWRKLGEIAAEFLKKGSLIYVEGKMRSEKYTGKDNVERKIWKVIVSELKMLGSKTESAAAKPTNQPSNQISFDDVPF